MFNIVPLFSSSKGNSILIESDDTRLLVDVGVSAKQLCLALDSLTINPNSIEAILITHEHSDHIKGIRVFASKYSIPVFATKKTWQKLNSVDISDTLKNFFEPNVPFNIGNIEVSPFSTPHDAIDPCGFNFFYNGDKLTIATDLGHINQYLLDKMEASSSILLESNHDVNMLKAGDYPYQLKERIIGNFGHLSNMTSAMTVEYLAKRGTKNFIMGHLSQDNNFPELALETIKSQLKLKNIPTDDISIKIAKPSIL